MGLAPSIPTMSCPHGTPHPFFFPESSWELLEAVQAELPAIPKGRYEAQDYPELGH